jgi:hypothetical protein
VSTLILCLQGHLKHQSGATRPIPLARTTGLHLNQQTLWQQWKSTAPDGVHKSRGITSPVFRTWAAAQREEAECCDGLAVGSALFVDANIVNAMVIMRLMFMPILSCVSSTCEATSNRQTSHGQRASNSALTKQLGSLRRPVSIWQRATNRSLVMRTTCAGNVISKSLALPKLGSARHTGLGASSARWHPTCRCHPARLPKRGLEM